MPSSEGRGSQSWANEPVADKDCVACWRFHVRCISLVAPPIAGMTKADVRFAGESCCVDELTAGRKALCIR